MARCLSCGREYDGYGSYCPACRQVKELEKQGEEARRWREQQEIKEREREEKRERENREREREEREREWKQKWEREREREEREREERERERERERLEREREERESERLEREREERESERLERESERKRQDDIRLEEIAYNKALPKCKYCGKQYSYAPEDHSFFEFCSIKCAIDCLGKDGTEEYARSGVAFIKGQIDNAFESGNMHKAIVLSEGFSKLFTTQQHLTIAQAFKQHRADFMSRTELAKLVEQHQRDAFIKGTLEQRIEIACSPWKSQLPIEGTTLKDCCISRNTGLVCILMIFKHHDNLRQEYLEIFKLVLTALSDDELTTCKKSSKFPLLTSMLDQEQQRREEERRRQEEERRRVLEEQRRKIEEEERRKQEEERRKQEEERRKQEEERRKQEEERIRNIPSDIEKLKNQIQKNTQEIKKRKQTSGCLGALLLALSYALLGSILVDGCVIFYNIKERKFTEMSRVEIEGLFVATSFTTFFFLFILLFPCFSLDVPKKKKELKELGNETEQKMNELKQLEDKLASMTVEPEGKQNATEKKHDVTENTAEKPKEVTSASSEDSDEDGFEGKHVVLAGEFIVAPKEQIEKLLKDAGAIIQKSVTLETEMVIVGKKRRQEQKLVFLDNEVERAKQLQGIGQNIQILSEEDVINS